ncbi:hypothetical protein G6F70_009277 [Rhizopus microsporus]|nr:hypothetical protein G6F70_009277 [Rhizopus microsporus]KAG1225469.1 hypothetical protein G6F67_009290 [Rhizopus microsporus]KAG1256109.1 hypothetical protein G6F68_009930 [Rhizopus microsporus]
MQVEKEIKPGSDVVMSETSMKRNYTPYSDQDKVRFFKLLFERCLSATAVAKRLEIHARTAQIWVEQYEKDPNCIFEKQRKTNRPGILNEKHKKVILVCIDTNPSVVLNDTIENLRHRFYEKLCLDESAFHFNLKADIAKYVECRGYCCVYLPSYSSELNPIEQLWSVVMSKVKRQRYWKLKHCRQESVVFEGSARSISLTSGAFYVYVVFVLFDNQNVDEYVSVDFIGVNSPESNIDETVSRRRPDGIITINNITVGYVEVKPLKELVDTHKINKDLIKCLFCYSKYWNKLDFSPRRICQQTPIPDDRA